MMFAHQFRRYSYARLPFSAVPAGDIFQRKIGEIFNLLPNVFGIADNILIVGYGRDETDHNETEKNTESMQKGNIKLNIDKKLLHVYKHPFLGK